MNFLLPTWVIVQVQASHQANTWVERINLKAGTNKVKTFEFEKWKNSKKKKKFKNIFCCFSPGTNKVKTLEWFFLSFWFEAHRHFHYLEIELQLVTRVTWTLQHPILYKAAVKRKTRKRKQKRKHSPAYQLSSWNAAIRREDWKRITRIHKLM